MKTKTETRQKTVFEAVARKLELTLEHIAHNRKPGRRHVLMRQLLVKIRVEPDIFLVLSSLIVVRMYLTKNIALKQVEQFDRLIARTFRHASCKATQEDVENLIFLKEWVQPNGPFNFSPLRILIELRLAELSLEAQAMMGSDSITSQSAFDQALWKQENTALHSIIKAYKLKVPT